MCIFTHMKNLDYHIASRAVMQSLPYYMAYANKVEENKKLISFIAKISKTINAWHTKE